MCLCKQLQWGQAFLQLSPPSSVKSRTGFFLVITIPLVPWDLAGLKHLGGCATGNNSHHGHHPLTTPVYQILLYLAQYIKLKLNVSTTSWNGTAKQPTLLLTLEVLPPLQKVSDTNDDSFLKSLKEIIPPLKAYVCQWVEEEDQEYKAAFAAEQVWGQSGFHETLSRKTKQTQFEIFIMFLNFRHFINKKVWFGEGASADETRPAHTPEPPRDWKDKEHSCRSDVGYTAGGNRKRLVKSPNTGIQIRDRQEGTLHWMLCRTIGRGTFPLSKASAREKRDLHGERLRCRIWCDAKT